MLQLLSEPLELEGKTSGIVRVYLWYTFTSSLPATLCTRTGCLCTDREMGRRACKIILCQSLLSLQMHSGIHHQIGSDLSEQTIVSSQARPSTHSSIISVWSLHLATLTTLTQGQAEID